MDHDPSFAQRLALTRRSFLGGAGLGLGAVALATLLGDRVRADDGQRRTDPLAPKLPHFRPRAKSVIYLNMTGAPSQIDLFEDKPKLRELDGQPIPKEYLDGQRFAFIPQGKQPNILAPLWKIERRGESRAPMSELLPQMSTIVDDVTFVRGMHTSEINHVPAQLMMISGSPRMGRPTMGAWVSYGLGSECADMPGYVVLASGKAGRCGTSCWSSGFLPSSYSGVQLRSQGDAVLYLSNPPGVDAALRRDTLDVLSTMNHAAEVDCGDPEIASRIAAYELAFRMQTSVPDLMDIAREPAAVREMYGVEPGQTSFANNCLLARRLVERGVRFIELAHGGWDHHGGGDQNLVTGLPERCKQVDRGAAALITDLKQRGLLDSTLVIFGGEFGRTPMIQGEFKREDLGRDHLATAFTMLLAGGGVKRGFSHGETDDLGMSVIKDAVHVHDLQATILHVLGLDHEKLTYKYQGRQFRLTDVEGGVVRAILA